MAIRCSGSCAMKHNLKHFLFHYFIYLLLWDFLDGCCDLPLLISSIYHYILNCQLPYYVNDVLVGVKYGYYKMLHLSCHFTCKYLIAFSSTVYIKKRSMLKLFKQTCKKFSRVKPRQCKVFFNIWFKYHLRIGEWLIINCYFWPNFVKIYYLLTFRYFSLCQLVMYRWNIFQIVFVRFYWCISINDLHVFCNYWKIKWNICSLWVKHVLGFALFCSTFWTQNYLRFFNTNIYQLKERNWGKILSWWLLFSYFTCL